MSDFKDQLKINLKLILVRFPEIDLIFVQTFYLSLPKITLNVNSENKHSHASFLKKALSFSECANWDEILPSILTAILK